MHWKRQQKRGWGLIICQETLAFSRPIQTRSAGSTDGPWWDTLASSAAFWIEIIGWPERSLVAQGDQAAVSDLRRSADAGHRQVCEWAVVRTARLQMLSITQPAPATCGVCVQTCSHSGNTHTYINSKGFISHPAGKMMHDSNTEWGMAHLLWLICSSPIVGILYIHIQYLHTSGMSWFVAKRGKC